MTAAADMGKMKGRKGKNTMNMPLILLYNLDNPKGAKIRRMCLPLGLRTRLVTPEEYGLPLGELVDGAAPQTPWTGEPFGDEMLVLVNCTGPLLDRFLQGFRRNKIPPVPLKAVLTPTNRTWDSAALHTELIRERQAIQQGQADHAKQSSSEEGNNRA